MDEIVVIDGEISLENTLDGEVELEAITDLDPEVVLSTGGAVYPHYSGSYTVTPSGSVQVLDTSDKVMDDDVTVQAVQAGSATTPATIITANPSISVSSGGLITATVSKTQQITPTVVEGYVSAGTAGNVGVSGSNSQQLTTQGAQTIHPASTDQSISSGKYLTGAQTFKAVTVSGLTADKVLQGTTVEIGDSDDSDRIMKVVGTATGGGTEEPEPLDVDFIDYDGTVVYTYTANDFLALDALPANPSHDGLTAQGWNWTLADAKDFVQQYGTLVVGQNYTTSDGKTRIYVHIEDASIPMPLMFRNTVANAVTIDWGDGSTDTSSYADANTRYTHTYAETGDYVIALTVNSGKMELGMTTNNRGLIYADNNGQMNAHRVNVYKIEVGSNVQTLCSDCFRFISGLKTLSLPTDVQTMGSSTFQQCVNLTCVVIPSGVTSFGNVVDANNLKYICMPKSLTSPQLAANQNIQLRKLTGYISTTYNNGYAYTAPLTHFALGGTYTNIYSSFARDCYNLQKIYIPASVTGIADYAFATCYSVREIHLAPTTPPTLANARAFSGQQSNPYVTAVFYVPYSADHSVLTAYKTASNWSTFASMMQEEPQT